MRVLLISTHFIHYGMELANGLAEDGVEVGLVFHPRNASELIGEGFSAYLDERVHHLVPPGRHTSKPWHLSSIRNLCWYRKVIKDFHPDVVHVQATNDVATLWTALRTNIPLVVTIHDVTAHPGDERHQPPLFKKIVRNLLIPSAIKRNVQFITHGESLKSSLSVEFGIPKRNVHMIPHGVLHGMNTSVSFPVLRKGRRGGGLRVLFFGRMERYKGLEVLCAAIPMVLESDPSVEFFVAGRGSALDENISRLESLPNVAIYNQYLAQDEVDDLFMKVDLNLAPYTEASQSGVIALGYGYGLPSIASDIGALGEVVFDQENGLLIQPGSAQDLAKAILQVARDEDLLKFFQDSVYQFSIGPLAWTSVAKQTKELYFACLREG